MRRLFLETLGRFLILIWQSLLSVKPSWPSAKRIAFLLVFLPLFLVVQLIHWLGFFLDEIFFRGYRSVSVREPLFVLGIPRSGTTLLHRTLAESLQFTTFSTWECLFAPSITQRKFWQLLGRIDQVFGGLLAAGRRWVEGRLLAGLDGVHLTRLDAAEEDCLTLMPILACFILMVPFPHAQHVWRMGAFDRDMSDAQRQQIMRWYRAMLQKHLYVHGVDKRLLSKNAAFASLLESLAEEFNDARFIICMRDPAEALPSQLSALAPGLQWCGTEQYIELYRQRMLSLFAHYYAHFERVVPKLAKNRYALAPMQDLQQSLGASVTAYLNRLGVEVDAAFAERLQACDRDARSYATRHTYTLESQGLDAQDVKRVFGDTCARLGIAAEENPC